MLCVGIEAESVATAAWENRRSWSIHPRIAIDPDVMFGKPVIRGTRITVEVILRKLAADMTFDEIIASHPHLAREDILAAIAFAARQIGNDVFVLATASER